ncbi:diguanylate cyclase [Schinkia azotoformans]|uniref:GGDEF domain-containing protein n=1 Tax=Schinkia azotoformans TaxID=1454 RepID=UPI002DCEC1D6|nr:diguanylate cyclase [Schinkia azotoformans]MEC1943506.1 diguanylate cyclase [Schinkia azotoformans]
MEFKTLSGPVSMLGPVVCFLLWYVGYRLMAKGLRIARFYVIAWSILLLTVIIQALSFLYIIPFHPMIFELIPKNHIFGRWGGEEFLLICPETSKIEALPLAEYICSSVESHDFPVVHRNTCSFGVATYHHGESMGHCFHALTKDYTMQKTRGEIKHSFIKKPICNMNKFFA